jgi:hypothetical protein
MKSTKKEPQAYQPPQVMDYGNVKQITMGNPGARGGDGSQGQNRTAA